MGWINFLPGKKSIQSTGKTNSLREAILFDHTSDIGISICVQLTQFKFKFKLKYKFKFYNLNLKNFFRKKLSKTPTTTAIVSNEMEGMQILSDDVIKKYIDHEEEINIKLIPKICCPEFVGTNLIIDAACTNDNCGKTVTTVPGERIVTCMNCNNTIRVKKWKCILCCVLIFENILLPLPADVAFQYFQEDVMKLCQSDKN